jgi:hypothetical protein
MGQLSEARNLTKSHWGQENACREEGQELKRLRQVEGRFAVGELAENFEEMGHLGHLRH